MGALIFIALFKDLGSDNLAALADSDGKYSGSWKRYKGAVAYWFKLIVKIVLVFLASAIGIFLSYKFYLFSRRKSLLTGIAKLEAELEPL
jgi:hypothetical protein